MSSEFSKESMDAYLRELAKEYRRLVGKNMPAEIVLIGGAAIIANYGFRESTTDIDAIIHAASAMKDAINTVGDKFDLPNGWLNSDFTQTDSYSPRLVEHSTYYKTFSNVVTVRTVEAEYLIAMKLRSGRQYKYDLSDVVGILAEAERKGKPISLEQIQTAYTNMYGSWETMPESSKELLERVMSAKDYAAEYEKVAGEEREHAKLLKGFEQDYPGAANAQNVNSILAKLKAMQPSGPEKKPKSKTKSLPER